MEHQPEAIGFAAWPSRFHIPKPRRCAPNARPTYLPLPTPTYATQA